MASKRYELNFGSANAGRAPTFSFFVDQSSGSAVTQPTIVEASYGGGAYYFDWDWAVSSCQTISFMAALNGIELAEVISGLPAVESASGTVRYEVNFGSANAGGAPVLSIFADQATGAAIAAPAITEAPWGNGSYYFDWDWTTSSAGTITWVMTLAGIELADVISGVASTAASTMSAAATSAYGWQTVGQIVARVAIQSGLLSLTRAQVLTYDPFASTDANIAQLLELLDTLGLELVSELKGSLEKTFSLTTVGTATSYALPVDYVEMADETAWNTTGVHALLGPVSVQHQQCLIARNDSGTAEIPYRVQGNRLTFPVAPAAGLTITGVYHSRYWVQSAGSSSGPDSDHALAYTDLVAFDPTLAVLGLRYQFLAAKGFDTVAALASYEKRLEWAKGAVSGSRTLSLLGGDPWGSMISTANLPTAPWGT